ncbi:MAG: GIY-YIG nuclease family protein [Cyclobacteriaceae bacterium]|nr:GIY-YIG nuclease family protein [Cyclobacteriaceae bacterium]
MVAILCRFDSGPGYQVWVVYVLQSLKSGKYYVGMSSDVSRRLEEHNSGKSKYTSGHRPWKLVYTEQAGSAIEARKREKYLKSAAGKRFLKAKIAAGSLPD